MPTLHSLWGWGVDLPHPEITRAAGTGQAVLGLRGKALRIGVNQTWAALSAWKAKFFPSPAPLGSDSVGCADVPWRCLCEILLSAQARGAEDIGLLPWTGNPQSLAQPLILLNPHSLWLWLPLLSHFFPSRSCLLFPPSVTNLFFFTLLSAEFTPLTSISLQEEGNLSAAAVCWVKYATSCLFLHNLNTLKKSPFWTPCGLAQILLFAVHEVAEMTACASFQNAII